ncbi:MAG: hypothetical protein KA162_02180 [Xanthomonadales bacterium]|nr:hypothetical protein [Xanthomonadales bacterium]
MLAICLGLASYVRQPRLPGSAPDGRVATVYIALAGSFLGVAESLPFDALAALDGDRVGGEWFTALPLTREVWADDRSLGRQTLAWTTGDLLPILGVPILGRTLTARSLALDLQGDAGAEVVLTRTAARAWFGSEAAAIGRSIRWQSIGDTRPGSTGSVEFRIVGVALSAFDGPVAERPVVGWVPLGAWPYAIVPRGMQDVVAPLRPQFIGLKASRGFVAGAASVNHWLQFSSRFSTLRAALLPGVGDTPQRRIVYRAWGDALLLNALAMAVVLVATYVATRFVMLMRQRASDAVRMAVGETRGRWWARRAGAELIAALVVVACAAVVVATLGVIPPKATGLPLRETLNTLPGGLQAMALWLLVATIIATVPLVLQSWVSGTPTMGKAKSGIRRLKHGAMALIVVSACAVVVVAGTATLGVHRALEFSTRDFGFEVEGLQNAPVVRSEEVGGGVPSVLDGRSIAAMIDGVSMDRPDSRVAAATAAPIGVPNVVSSVIQWNNASRSDLVSINFVTSNYFSLIGTPATSWCGPLGMLGEHQAIANRVFLRQHGLPAGPSAARIRASIPSASATFPEIEICGLAEDAQYADARGSATPTIYLPLRQASGLGVVLWRGESGPELAAIGSTLAAIVPGATLGPSRPVAERIAEDLRLDLAVALLSILIMVVVSLVAVAMCVSTLLAALEWMRPELAVRWTFGAGRWELALALVRARLWPASLLSAALVTASLLVVSLLSPSGKADALPLAWAIGLAAGACCVGAGLAIVRSRIDDSMLARALGESERL